MILPVINLKRRGAELCCERCVGGVPNIIPLSIYIAHLVLFVDSGVSVLEIRRTFILRLYYELSFFIYITDLAVERDEGETF